MSEKLTGGAFLVSFVPITVAKESGLIPEPWHRYFEDTCGYCDAPMMISESRTVYKCTNPYCTRRVSGMIAAMLQDLGIKGFGKQSAYNYMRSTGVSSVLEFIYSPPPELRGLADIISSRHLTYAKLIKIMHFPRLGSRGDAIFAGCNSYADFLAKADQHGGVLPYIQKCVGGSDLPMMINEILYSYSEEMKLATEVVQVVPASKTIIKIVMTGEVSLVRDSQGKRVTKDRFIMLLNDIVRPAGVAFERSEAVESVPFIVADSESTHRKYLVGKRRGNLITSELLLSVCRDIIDEYYSGVIKDMQDHEDAGPSNEEPLKESVPDVTSKFGGSENV